MCGFIGIIRNKQNNSKHDVEFYKPLLKNRGPDDFRFFHSPCGKIELYFYRLSIIDLDHGFQPSISASKKIISVFNGEIYNYQELRHHLMTLGVHLQTQGDAEVIPNLYEIYGEDFVSKLRGMFSILIWDGEKVLSYRDRLGIKPLYYSTVNDQICFSSEAKPLLLINPNLQQEINEDAIDDYLNYGYSLAPHNIFKNIHTVPPATLVKVQNGHISEREYWKVTQVENKNTTEPQALELIDHKLDEVTKLHLQADVPAGIFLSGGFDSGILAAKLARTHPETRAYTLRFPEKTIDESLVAKEIAQMHGLQQTVYDVTSKDLLKLLTESIWQVEAPFADSGILANMFISQKVQADGIKVALCGAGGDEIFSGYTYHTPTELEKKIMSLGNAGYNMTTLLTALYPSDISGKIKRASAFSSNPLFHYIAKTRVFNNFDHYGWEKDLKVQFFKHYQQWPHSARLIADLKTYIPDNLMLLIDRATMAHSIEGRVPFLDHELVELMMSIPSEIRTPNGERKGLLKKIGSKILPPSIYTLPKIGFNSPVEQWMNGELGTIANSVLSIDKIKHRSYYKLLKKRNIHLEKLNFHQKWTLLQLELFYKMFVDSTHLKKAPTLEELL